MHMEIKNLTISDYEKITRLWEKAGLPFKPRGRDSREAMTAEIAAHPDFFLGAFKTRKLIGVVVLSSDLRKGWINRLAVDPDSRSLGVAKALIAESERILRKRDIRLFCALIEEDNEVSKRLFGECGYVEHHNIVYFCKRDSEEV
jgi:GNAT superfamily N-acetyltransferase